MEILDNFLSLDQLKNVQRIILGENFPWYYNSYVNDPDEDRKHSQFTHGFYHYLHDNPWNSNYCGAIACLFESFSWNEIRRVKANLIPKTQSHIISGYHVDDFSDHKVAIFYLNTNNGFTTFENGAIVNCIENRMLFFDGSLSHSSVTCTDAELRVVININYI